MEDESFSWRNYGRGVIQLEELWKRGHSAGGIMEEESFSWRNYGRVVIRLEGSPCESVNYTEAA